MNITRVRVRIYNTNRNDTTILCAVRFRNNPDVRTPEGQRARLYAETPAVVFAIRWFTVFFFSFERARFAGALHQPADNGTDRWAADAADLCAKNEKTPAVGTRRIVYTRKKNFETSSVGIIYLDSFIQINSSELST